jgi:hypothetical protein
VIDWRRVPWSLGLYILWTVGLSGWLVFHVSGPIAAQVLFSSIVITWAFFMLKGVRWLWIATVAVSVLSFISSSLSVLGRVCGVIVGHEPRVSSLNLAACNSFSRPRTAFSRSLSASDEYGNRSDKRDTPKDRCPDSERGIKKPGNDDGDEKPRITAKEQQGRPKHLA